MMLHSYFCLIMLFVSIHTYFQSQMLPVATEWRPVRGPNYPAQREAPLQKQLSIKLNLNHNYNFNYAENTYMCVYAVFMQCCILDFFCAPLFAPVSFLRMECAPIKLKFQCQNPASCQVCHKVD